MKRGLKSQQPSFTKLKTEQEAATRASFRVAFEIAKRGKPFTDGEMIKECIIAVVEEMCPEKVNLLKTAANCLKNFLICIVFMAQLLIQIFLR
nr:unnamed protein product [Callosobruchus analis]